MPIRPRLAEKSTVIQRHKLKLNKSYIYATYCYLGSAS